MKDNKKIAEFKLHDDTSVYIEVEDNHTNESRQRISRESHHKNTTFLASKKFEDAIKQVRPAAEAVINSFREIEGPDEIALEFGLKFNIKSGVIFASVDNEATFKVNLKWKVDE